MAPSAERKRAGFVIGDRLRVGMYGETCRAAGAGRRDLHALVVDATIAGEPGVASTLLDDAVPALRPVHHRAIVGTVAAVRDGGELVVITEEVPDSTSLHELLGACRARGIKVPAEIAAAIGRAIVDAAATVHAAGVVHGAIHPRSVLIDGEGQVRLADFAIGRAVATAAARGASADLLRPLIGYVAPEVVAGEEPTPATDVHALGALLFVMLTGELPPGSLHTSPAIERLVHRALDPDLARRFTSAVELQENLSEAIEDDRWSPATTAELVRFVARARAGDALDAATEDLLASLGSSLTDAPTRSALDLEDGEASAVGGVPAGTGSLDAVIADLDDPDDAEEGDDPLTEVDGARSALRGQPARDPISEMLAIERARTGEPELEIPLPAAKSGGRARRVGTPASSGAPGDDDAARAAADAIASLTGDDDDELDAPAPRRAAAPAAARRPSDAVSAVLAPDLGDPVGVPSLAAPRKLGGLVWLVVLLAAGAGLVWVVMDLQGKSKAQQAAEEKRERERQEELDRQRALQEDPGAIRVTSSPDEAAVWLLLGRTPAASIPLPTGQIHELRVELDGHLYQDVVVSAKDWTGEGNDQRATVAVTLQAGTAPAPPPPMPPPPPAELQRGLVQGRGRIHVESTPAGAAVWLLVGKTNSMRLEQIEAGRDYELKVLKPGHVPGYAYIKAEEWRKPGGDPSVPLAAAPKFPVLERHVELVPAPDGKPEKK